MYGKIKLNKEAVEFLEAHGWVFNRYNHIASHELFIFSEDFSNPSNDIVKFCEHFYANAWEAYLAGQKLFKAEAKKYAGKRSKDVV